MKDFIVVQEPLGGEVVRDPVLVGRRTKGNLRKALISLLWHMLPSYLRWRVIWFTWFPETLGNPRKNNVSGHPENLKTSGKTMIL